MMLLLLLLLSPQDDARVLDAARATMKSAQNCFLITLDAAGQPQARLMAPFDAEPSMTVWLATNRTTRKVAQIRKNPRATLAYHDAAGVGYVTLVGRARIVPMSAEAKHHWKEEWRAFYPRGPDDPNYVLIEFTPSRIEVMSISRHVADAPQGWEPAILERHAGEWQLTKR